jgi:hypothetical protein
VKHINFPSYTESKTVALDMTYDCSSPEFNVTLPSAGLYSVNNVAYTQGMVVPYLGSSHQFNLAALQLDEV